MDPTITIVIAIGAAIGGGFVAAVVTSIVAPRLNALFEARRRRKTILNKTLYALFRLYGQLRTGRRDEYLASLRKRAILTLGPEGYSALQIERAYSLFMNLDPEAAADAADAWLGKYRKSAREHLEGIITEISSIAPLLAFSMSRRHGTLEIFEKSPTNDEKSKDLEFRKILFQSTFGLQRQRLEKDIRALSFHIGFITYLRTRLELFRWQSESKKYTDQLFEETFDNYIRPGLMRILQALANPVLEQLSDEEILALVHQKT